MARLYITSYLLLYKLDKLDKLDELYKLDKLDKLETKINEEAF